MKNQYNLGLQEGKDFFLKKNHWLPEKMGVDYLAFGKTLYVRNSDPVIPRHEFYHIAQFHKFGIPMVVGHYIYHLVKNLIKYKSLQDAFIEIPFEIEAREYEAKMSKDII